LSIQQALWPKSPRNFAIASGVAALLLLVYGAAAWGRVWSPKRGFGLAFGILAALLFVFEMGYPFRRPKARPLGSARAWMQAHVYLGAIAFLGVLAHAGFSLPHGIMGWGLLLLSAWVTVSGLAGVFLQKWIPAALSEGLRVEALYERIPALVEGLLTEADELMEGTSESLDTFYRRDVREALSRLKPSWVYVVDVRAGRDRALEPFRRMAQFVPAEEKVKVSDLMEIYIEKLELDAQHRMQQVLRRWLVWTAHVPAAGLLMGLLFIHVLTWMIY
jgi:hypothetical protein